MKIREPKDTDQEQTEKAFQLLKEFCLSHPEIEFSLWMGAFCSAIVDMHLAKKVSFEYFRQTMIDVAENYKDWFEDEVD